MLTVLGCVTRHAASCLLMIMLLRNAVFASHWTLCMRGEYTLFILNMILTHAISNRPAVMLWHASIRPDQPWPHDMHEQWPAKVQCRNLGMWALAVPDLITVGYFNLASPWVMASRDL